MLLYDCKRDGDIKHGEAVLVFEDGTTRHVVESSLYPKEKLNAREPIKKSSAVRSRPSGTIKHREKSPRHTPQRKRVAVYSA